MATKPELQKIHKNAVRSPFIQEDTEMCFIREIY